LYDTDQTETDVLYIMMMSNVKII